MLQEVGPGSGLDFRFEAGSRGRHDLPEIMGGGVGLIDVDGDGRLDLYFTNGGPIAPTARAADPPCRLYRNLGDGRFEERTATAAAPGPSYAMGVAVADYDGDGRSDLLVTGWRDQRLYRNLGGRFEDVTDRAGVGSKRWSTSAAWADLDGDGDHDLYVAGYLTYDPAAPPYCAAPDGRRDYCGPEEFAAEPDTLYRNNGDGTFTDVSAAAGIDRRDGRGLGVLVADLVGDPRPDLFVANDGSANFLFENLGALRFREVALTAGVALDGQGQALAGMGTSVGDIDGDGRPDLVVGNLQGRSSVAFLGRAPGLYADQSAACGLTVPTRGVTGFGLALVDLDGDDWLDLIQANGHVVDRARLGTPLLMRPTWLRNQRGRFRDVGRDATGWAQRGTIGRGLAVGGLDGDDRPDIVLAHLDAPPTLLRNHAERPFLRLELVGRSPAARVPFGARARITSGGRTLVRDLPGGGSYLSASEPAVWVGWTGAPRIDRVVVTWPSGRSESWQDVPARSPARFVETTGAAVPAP